MKNNNARTRRKNGSSTTLTTSSSRRSSLLDPEGIISSESFKYLKNNQDNNNVNNNNDQQQHEHEFGEDVSLILEEKVVVKEKENYDIEDDDDDDDVEISASLTHNTYSIIYVAKFRDRAFWCGIIIFLFQSTLPVLALWNLIDTNTNNWLQIPIDADKAVHAAGYLSLVLSIPYFPDLLDSIERFHEGYHPIVAQQCKYATFRKVKWLFSTCLQFFVGLLFQLVIFVLVVQSTTVIGMFLNFAALAFITEIDDVAFSLQERGYFSSSMERACHDVKELKTPNTKGPWFKRLVFLFFVAVVIAAYTVVLNVQKQGLYSCRRLEIQFGDGYWSKLPLYSGTYFVKDPKKRLDDRLVYVDEVSGGQTSIFRYCHHEEAWVFGIFNRTTTTSSENNTPATTTATTEDNNEEDLLYDEICMPGKWISKSPVTKSYDILDEHPMDWTTHLGLHQENDLMYPVDHFFMGCMDCNTETCNALGGTCEKEEDSSSNNGGNIVVEYCKCKEGFLGNHCQYKIEEDLCDIIEYDHRHDPFPQPIASRFDLAKYDNGTILEYFDKAVYAYVFPEHITQAVYILAFFGRRFVLLFSTYGSSNKQFANSTENTVVGDYIEYLKQIMENGFLSNNGDNGFDHLYISEEMDVGTPKDKLTPMGLFWFVPTYVDEANPLGIDAPTTTHFLCGTCNPDAGFHCDIFGQCEKSNNETASSSNINYNNTGRCVCTENIIEDGDGYVGPLCEAYVENVTEWYDGQWLEKIDPK